MHQILAPPPPHSEDERLVHELQEQPTNPTVKHFVQEPISAIKSVLSNEGGSEFAENIAKSEVPHGASVNLLRQEEKLTEATTEEEIAAETEAIVQLKRLRQDAFARWSIDRHVREVSQILELNELSESPKDTEEVQNASSWPHWVIKLQQVSWHDPDMHDFCSPLTQLLRRWLDRHAQLYIDDTVQAIEPDRKLLASSLERIVVASTHLQELFMNLRSISRWEDPRKSAAYAAIYFLLVFKQQLVGMAVCCLLFL